MSSSLSISVVKHVLLAVMFMGLGALLTLLFMEHDVTAILQLLHSKNPLNDPSALLNASRRDVEALDVLQAASRTDDIVYLPAERMLTAVAAKGGSTSFWKWLYTGITGRKEFDCSTYVQDVRATCWQQRAIPFADLTQDEKLFALSNDSVLRLAVWRDPFSRLISCWKSKFACDAWLYATDYSDRERMVPQLRQHARLSPLLCLNISQFAETLDHVRRRLEKRELNLLDLNPHLIPQNIFFHLINYTLVIDVDQLSNPSAVLPVAKRLPYLPAAGPAPHHLHASAGADILLPESAANLISRFAALTETIPSTAIVDGFS